MRSARTRSVLFGSTLMLCAGTLAVAVAPASAVPVSRASVDPGSGPDYEMPFLCGQTWTGTKRPYHSQSVNAIDWNAPNDEGTPIVAAAPGVVSKVDPTGTSGYGHYAIIDHGNGQSTLYAHMKLTWLVAGMPIDQSQPIGFLGGTGNVTGPHLHFEERLNSSDFAPYFHRTRFRMNTSQVSTNCPDSPIAGDWNGDGKTDVGVFHRSASGASWDQLAGTKTTSVRSFGTGWDQVFVGDWNGDKKTDVGVRPPGNPKFVLRAANGALTKITYGSILAVPVSGDWNGDGTAEIGVWRPDLHRFAERSASGQTTYVTFGATGDQPVTGDWNGDGKTDVGVYRPSTRSFLLRTVSSTGAVTTTTVPLGASGDLPVVGDWNGDKIWDVGVWSPSKAVFTLRYVAQGSRTAVFKTVAYGARRG
ncbi:MAG: VCBS repeat domain-containing M23 family metallopeptidase [Actinomycetota bacterium]|nr:VCBS repeat domain-containing M23 family metallopeptidase [Actinomycetota bacterium]